MEVIPSRSGGSGSMPFQRHNVKEWSRVDSVTGMLEHARVETGHWASNTSTSSQQYGKVVDSRARNLVDGSVHQRQRKQLEVFQAQVPGGSLQVIRTQSVTSTSSSSCSWRAPLHSDTNVPTDFENIQLPINPLDISSQRTKASVGRSGSIGSRRPPSRPRSIINKVESGISEENFPPDAEVQDVDKRLSEVSRVCQQIHEEAKSKVSNSLPSEMLSSSLNDNMLLRADYINRRGCSDGNKYGCKSDGQNSLNTFDKVRKADDIMSNGLFHAILARKKSCSTEDLQNNDYNEKDSLVEGREIPTDLIRTLGARRSLQLPNKGNRSDVSNGNVSKICKELEDRKSLDTMNDHATSFGSFENTFKYDTESARNSSLLSENNRQLCSINSLTNKSANGYELEGFSRKADSTKGSSHKRHSFVTVESLKEVRGRLRHLGSPPLDDIRLPNNSQTKDVEDSDDGIVTEDFNKAAPGMNLQSIEEIPTSCVKSYVYGMETMANSQNNIRKSTAGTGSLESRASNRSSSSGGNRSEEWYNRRKSYGFEQVHNQQAHNRSEPVALKEKSRVESSTDSGICRSSETVIPSSWTPFNKEEANDQTTLGNLKANHSIKLKQHSDDRRIIDADNRVNESNSHKGRRTVVTLGSDNEDNRSGLHMKGSNFIETSSTAISNSWRSGCESRAVNNLNTNTSAKSVHRLSVPITITIPVVSDDSFSSIDRSGITARKLYFNQLSEQTNLSAENRCRKSGTFLTSGNSSPPKNLLDEPRKTLADRRELLLKHSGGSGWSPASRQTDIEIKRHSIAVDETKYVREGLKSYNLYEKRKGNFNFENELKTIPTNISDIEKNTCLNLSNEGDLKPFQKELEYKISASAGMPQDGRDFKSASFTYENDDCDEFLLQHHLAGKKHKKVEFCKTEVHFAAEPGRFNIVETDEKPPPNNIRRRRRNSSGGGGGGAVLVTHQVQDANKTSLPEIRFGDSLYEKKLLGGNESNNTSYQIAVSADTQNQNKSNLDQLEPIMPALNSVSVFQDDADKEDNIFTQANATILSSGRQDAVEMGAHSNDEDISTDSIFLQSNSIISGSVSNVRPRSILKNNKKPHPFHLGETDEDILVSSLSEKSERSTADPEAKWGVRLKPVQNKELSLPSTSVWKSTVTLRNPTFDGQKQQDCPSLPTLQDKRLPSSQSFGEGTELNKPLKTLQPAFQRNSAGDAFEAPLVSKIQPPESIGGGMEVKISMAPPWSVAERVRQVEDLKHAALETRGYSTRVNFGAGETTVLENRLSDGLQKQSTSPKYQTNNRPKPIWLRREERKQEAMQQCDVRSQTTSDKGLVVHICKSEGGNEGERGSLDSSMKTKNCSRTQDINSSNVKKTTTILIDLSPNSSDNYVAKTELLQKDMLKKSGNEKSGKSTETLRSPSLIMKTINNSSQVQETEGNNEECSNHYMQGNERIIRNGICKQSDVPVAAPRTKKTNIQSQNLTNRYISDLSVKTAETNTNGKLLVKRTFINTQAKEERNEETLVVPNQLAALKELYYSAELSDDSERADEEVRSYMSGGGDEEDRDQDEDSSSVVSGSWSRVRAFRNIQHHFHKFNTSHKDHADISPIFKLDNSKEPSFQKSVTEAKLQSYSDSSRLCAVETLVSTRSGHPKITSISLRYEGEQNAEPLSQVNVRNPDCDLYEASFRSLPSTNRGNLHVTESKHSADFGVNTPFTATSGKSFNKPLIYQKNVNSDSSKSVFTQKQKELSSSFVESPFQPERQTSQFTTIERNYNNLNPRSPAGKNTDSFNTDQTLSLLQRRVPHPETEDKFMFCHNHNEHELSTKCSSKQELEPTVSSDRISSNRMSLSPVRNKSLRKDQKNKKLHASVPSGSNNSSDLIRSMRTSGEDMKKQRLSAREKETKKECNFYTEKQKLTHLEGTYICESEKETEVGTQCDEREKRANRVKSTSSISMKHDRSSSPCEIVCSQTDASSRKTVTTPVYENLKMVAAEPTKKSNSQNLITDTVETESAILEELTRAADQILQAVNGYTDEESYRASSDEPDDEIMKDGRRRRGNRCGQVRRPSASLGTIKEAPSSKKQQETGNITSELHSHKSNINARKSQRLTKTRPCPTSSTSSVESFTRENSRVQTRPLLKQERLSSVGECNRSKVASSSTSSTAIKSSSRTARLLQRASSRELLLQTYASSSEDVASGVEMGSNRKPMVPRRTRTHNSSNNKTDPAKTNLKKSIVSSDSQPPLSAKARSRKRDADINKPKERFPGSTNKMVPLVRKSSGGDSGSPSGGRLHTSRSRDNERYQRGSSRPTAKRDNTDLRHIAQGGSATTVEPSGRDRCERTIVYEHRTMGTMGAIGRSSASCVVTKKKLSSASSHNKGLVQIKGSK